MGNKGGGHLSEGGRGRCPTRSNITTTTETSWKMETFNEGEGIASNYASGTKNHILESCENTGPTDNLGCEK